MPAAFGAAIRSPDVSVADGWPSDYFDSRDRFFALARAGGARTERHPLTAVGPRGEALSIDVATLVPPDTEHLIVVSSGVHGVEGILGARVQLGALARLARRDPPKGIGIAMIHAVNPWGFAHLRRVDENNVDVNRNFLDPAAPRPDTHPRYPALDPLINPTGAPRAGDEARFWLRTAGLIARERGVAPLAAAIAEGQYAYPRGLFYGGARVGESCARVQSILSDLVPRAGRVTHLDVHSGLGRFAAVTLIGSGNVGTPDERARGLSAHYGRPYVADDADDNPYDARGTLARWYRRAADTRPFTYLCVEIGTLGPLRVLTALRRENRAHHWTEPGSDAYVRTKRALLDAFAPRSERWRRTSVAAVLDVLERTYRLPPQASDRGIERLHSGTKRPRPDPT